MGFVSELKQFKALKKRTSKVWLIEELDFVEWYLCGYEATR